MGKVAIVIVNYKTYSDLTKCLAALDKLEGKQEYNLNTIIIDSEYQDKEVKKLKKKYPKHIFVLQDRSDGVSANFNRGFKKAINRGAEYILMVTPDVYLEKNVLKTLMGRMQLNSNLGAVTSKMLLPTNPRKIYFVGGTLDPVAYTTGHVGYLEVDKGQYDHLRLTQTEFLNCAFVLIRSSVFKKAGFWEPSYFLTYEDADWTIRVKRAGYDLEIVKEVFAIHDESSTIGRKSMRQEYYMARNHLLFVKRNASLKNKILAYAFVLKKSIESLPNLLNSEKKERTFYILLGRFDFLRARFGEKRIMK